MSGSRNSSRSTRLPRKSRRANAYAAGTPSATDSTTTDSTTSAVTTRTEPSWNSDHASRYQLVVAASGSQVPSQRVATELTATAPTRNSTLTTKNAASPTSSPVTTRRITRP